MPLNFMEIAQQKNKVADVVFNKHYFTIDSGNNALNNQGEDYLRITEHFNATLFVKAEITLSNLANVTSIAFQQTVNYHRASPSYFELGAVLNLVPLTTLQPTINYVVTDDNGTEIILLSINTGDPGYSLQSAALIIETIEYPVNSNKPRP